MPTWLYPEAPSLRLAVHDLWIVYSSHIHDRTNSAAEQTYCQAPVIAQPIPVPGRKQQPEVLCRSLQASIVALYALRIEYSHCRLCVDVRPHRAVECYCASKPRSKLRSGTFCS